MQELLLKVACKLLEVRLQEVQIMFKHNGSLYNGGVGTAKSLLRMDKSTGYVEIGVDTNGNGGLDWYLLRSGG